MQARIAETLYVRQLALGPMRNFVYLIGEARGDEAAVVDPAWDVPEILRCAEADGRRVTAAFITHHHADHINGLPALLAARDVPVYAQAAEVDFAQALRPFREALRPVEPGAAVDVGGLVVRCLHTPGHTPGGQCLHCAGALFTGDTLFVDACGRCDLPGGDARQLFDSLHHRLGGLPDDTALFPGHDYGEVAASTLGRERVLNPYYQLKAEDDFVRHRLRPRG